MNIGITTVMWRLLTLCVVVGGSVGPAAAQSAGKPVELVVPYAPGGPNDVVARLLGSKLGPSLGQAVIVVNKPGAGSLVGTEAAALAKPDGSTFLFVATSFAYNPSLYPEARYDPLKSFTPVSLIGSTPLILVANPSTGFRSVSDVISAARAKPGGIAYASGGRGTLLHLAGEQLSRAAGVELLHVPYKGLGPANTDLLGGRLPLLIDTVATAVPFINVGKTTPLVVMSLKRSPTLPNVPTMVESGYPGFEAVAWFGLLAPAGTPKDIVDRMNREVSNAIRSTDVQERFRELGIDPADGTADEFAKYLASEVTKWTKAVKDAKVEPE
jgi:tripartite-type tricarboxylate transporter receptor subunit TctC